MYAVATPGLETTLLFAAATFGLLLSPGPNMALVVSQGLAHGPRGGVAAASGIAIADLVLTVVVALGVATLFARWAPAFDLLRYAGAGYLLLLACQALRARHGRDLPHAPARSTVSIVRLSVATSLLNPKALLFFMVFLPQFVAPERQHVPAQLLFLGAVLTLLAFVFHASLGIASARARGWAAGRLAGVAWVDRLQAAIFLGIAIRLVLMSRPEGA